MEWGDAQFMAASCIEQGAEVVGLDTTAGVTTLHIRCQLGGRSRSEPGSADVWITDRGYVMKSSLRVLGGSRIRHRVRVGSHGS